MSKASDLTILIIGSGGREHALAKCCLASPLAAKVIAAPGNGGMATELECHPVDVADPDDIVALAERVEADLVIIGPEVPLCAGAADALEAAGIATFGPSKAAARLEASKAYCKDFFARYGIPTAAYTTFTDLDAALAYLGDCAFPQVIKASGLAAGKGVIIAETREIAEEAIRSMISGTAFGDSGREVVIEEYLEGEEASIHALISGGTTLLLPASQDHKRIGEGDTGPNTGGMGAYAPADIVTPEMEREIRKSIIEPTLAGLQAEKLDFRGTLFIGLMLTPDGPRVLEFNVRFGDPETQVLLPLVAEDLVPIFLKVARGEALPDRLLLHPAYAMVVVLAARGYPGPYPKGLPILLPEQMIRSSGLVHAGTRIDPDGSLVTHGGRVLGVIGTGAKLKIAAAKAYEGVEAIRFEGKTYRHDIGWRQLERRRR